MGLAHSVWMVMLVIEYVSYVEYFCRILFYFHCYCFEDCKQFLLLFFLQNFCFVDNNLFNIQGFEFVSVFVMLCH